VRVLFVHPHMFAGGAEKAIAYTNYHLKQAGWKADVCTLSTELSDMPSIANDIHYVTPIEEISNVDSASTLGIIQRFRHEVSELRRLLERVINEYDIITACNFPAYWATYKFRGKKPIVWLSNEALAPYDLTRDLYENSIFFRSVLSLATYLDRYLVRESVDRIVTCSDLCASLIRKRYDLEAIVNPTAVDYAFFSERSSDARTRLGLDGSFVLLQVGALVKRKNQLLSIDLAERMKALGIAVKLVIVGEGPLENALRRETKLRGIDGDVIFTGLVSEKQLRTIFYSCDLNLFPAVDQTFGLVPLEALACGKISIVSNVSGVGQLIAREGIGITAPPEIDSFLISALKFYRERHRFDAMAEKGRRFVAEHLTWNQYADKMIRVYEALRSPNECR
jgi:glycosyltransferase involved in cell wall biosynthesis